MALLFAISMPLSAGFAAMAAPKAGGHDMRVMSCHEPAHAPTPDDGRHHPPDALQHLCCFTACIPLAAVADAAIALALPVGGPLLTLLTIRPLPRVIGVDPPPPKG